MHVATLAVIISPALEGDPGISYPKEILSFIVSFILLAI